MLGLLFLGLLVLLGTWAVVFRGLLGGVDVRPARPSPVLVRRMLVMEARLRALARAGVSMREMSGAFGRMAAASCSMEDALRAYWRAWGKGRW